MIKLKNRISGYFLPSQSSWIDVLVIGILILAAIIINLRMIRDGLNGTGDVRWHLTWIQHFSKQLSEGIWYPRWLAGTNYGYGSPTFVFYPPLPYYLGSILKLVGFNIEKSFSLLCTLVVFLCGLSFYIFGNNKFYKFPALVGALCYMLCPTIAIGLVGGVLSFLFAYIWIPIGVYATDQALLKPSRKIFVSLVFFLLSLTHLPSLLLFSIAWLSYLTFSLYSRPWQNVVGTLIAGGLGIGAASFYLLPAIVEQRLVNIQYMLASQSGFQKSEMLSIPNTIQKAFSQEIVSIQFWAILVFSIIAFIGYRNNLFFRKFTLQVFLFVLIIIFFISDWSFPIWQLSSTLQKVETSWRLSGLLFFGQAILCALAIQSLIQYRRLFVKVFIISVITLFLFLNFRFGFTLARDQPALYNPGKGKVFLREWIETIIHDPYSNRLVDVPEYRTILDNGNASFYRKEQYTDDGLIRSQNRASVSPSSPLPTPLRDQPPVSIVKGQAEFSIEEWKSYYRKVILEIIEPSTVRLRTYFYPGWQILVNNKLFPFQKGKDGTIELVLSPGNYTLILKYEKTTAYSLGIIISCLSFFVLAFVSIRSLKKRV